jgi:hypothetical protein
MKDFTRKRSEIKFTIDDEVFEAAQAIPADTLLDFAVNFQGLDEASGEDQRQSMLTILETVLLPESYQRFRTRMSNQLRPIELSQANDVIEWIMGEYGMRPTLPSVPSADGSASPESGTPSTENTAAEVLISSASPSTDS